MLARVVRISPEKLALQYAHYNIRAPISITPETGFPERLLSGGDCLPKGQMDLADNIVQEVKLRELNQGDERWKKIEELTAKSSRKEQ